MIRNLSIRHKFTAIIVVTTTIILLLASGLFVALEVQNYRRALVQELTAIAQITSSNSSAAILFDDQAAAQETLAALRARPNIEAAALFLPDGRLFSRYLATGLIEESAGLHHASHGLNEELGAGDSAYRLEWSGHSVDIVGPIIFDGEHIGAIQIRSNLKQIESTINVFLSVVLMIVLLAILLAWVLGSLLQRQITRPIYDLLATMGQVTREHDYALRAEKRGDDELGALVEPSRQTIRFGEDQVAAFVRREPACKADGQTARV